MTSETVTLQHLNDVYCRLVCDTSTLYELSDNFTFTIPNARFHPKVKARIWDGKIRLVDMYKQRVYHGLSAHIEDFCKDRGYRCENLLRADAPYSVVEAEDHIARFTPAGITPRPYQTDSFIHCVRKRRSLFVSPTASGKSLIIYWLARYYQGKILLIVDSVSLANQMYSDFKSYGMDPAYAHMIYSGKERNVDCPITITTWQTAVKLPKAWFAQYRTVIGDEAHKYKAKSLVDIMTRLEDCPHRFGFTGSLDGSLSNKMVLEGLFGPFKQIVTTKDLMDQGHVSPLEIKCIVLKHQEAERKACKGHKYIEEVEHLVMHEKRNRFIKNLALSLTGNTLLLFRWVDKHGEPLYEAIKPVCKIPLHYVSGKVDGEDREAIRQIVSASDQNLLIASIGTFATGINIPNINNIILASPTKSRIQIVQSIGRGLRLAQNKTHCTLYDLADDLSWKSKVNHTLSHFADRVKVYNQEKFNYRIYNVELT